MERPVLVTTAHRGVFFGYLNGEPDELPGKVTLKRCRNCIRWTSAERGFIGLATAGPSSACRIGPAVESITLYNVTSVADVAPTAVENWEKAPWN